MKKLLLSLLTVSLFLCQPALAAKKRTIEKLKFPEIKKITIPKIFRDSAAGGIKMRLIKTDKLPLVDMKIMVRGGSVFDPADKVGLAAVTAQLMRIGGAGDLTGAQLDQKLDSMGIQLSVGADLDYFTVNLSCLKEDLGQALDILASVLRSPRMAPEKLEEIKTQLGSAIARRNDEPNGIAAREFDRMIYGADSPFARVQEYEHIDNITAADIAREYKQYFAPGNMLMGVTGPVEMAELKAAVDKAFSSWNTTARVPRYPEVKSPESDVRVGFAEKSNLNQSYIYIGHLGEKEDLAEKPAIMIFNSIFSQGMDSRLFTRVRTKMGLTYGVGGGISPARLYRGTTHFTTFTKSASTLKAIRAIIEESRRIISEKVKTEELENARNYFINSYVFRFSSPEGILNSELKREFYGLPEGYSQQLLENIKKVTAEQVLATAKKFVHPDKFRILIVGKKADLDGKPSDLGQAKELNIAIKPPALKEKIPAATKETLAKGRGIIDKISRSTYRGYRRLKNVVMEADMTVHTPQGAMNMAMKTVSVYPDKTYSEMNIMGMKIETVVNGKQGVVRQMGQEKPLPAENFEKNRFGSKYDLFNHPDKYQIQYLRQEKIAGKDFHVLYLKGGKDQWVKLFVNTRSGLIEISEKLSQMPWASGVVREMDSDFRKVSGIPFAFKSVSRIKDKKLGESSVKKIKVNGPVDMKLFNLKKK